MTELAGQDTSLWIATTQETRYPKFEYENERYEAAVVGGGITGILTAYKLQRAGINTVLLEKNRIVENTTGNTTAKVTSQHYLIYSDLVKEHGEEVAKIYGKANEQAIDGIESLAQKLNIDCDFKRTDAYVFTNDSKVIKDIEKEVEVNQQLGLPSCHLRQLSNSPTRRSFIPVSFFYRSLRSSLNSVARFMRKLKSRILKLVRESIA
jgi:hypothetical protein